MKIDLTLRITPKMAADAQGNEKRALVGHLGTHFDVMDKEFPLEDTQRRGIVFDVRSVRDREIGVGDVDLSQVREDMFVAFCTGFIERVEYGTRAYFAESPQLSMELLHALLAKRISIIGVDFAGVRRGREHPPTDQLCADHGVFIVENLCHLDKLLAVGSSFLANTYPMNYAEVSGLPCRVIADVDGSL